MAQINNYKFRCDQCGQYDIIPAGIKTHKCSHCGYRNKVSLEGAIPVSDEEMKRLTPVPVFCPYCNSVNMVFNREHMWKCSICQQTFSVTYNDEVQQPKQQQPIIQPRNQAPKQKPSVNYVPDNDKKPFSFKKFAIGCFIAAAIIVLLCEICSGPERKNNTPETNKYSIEVIVGVKDYLRHTLKDPDSYQEIEWSQIGTNSDGQLYVRHQYRAKNSLGGYVVEDKIFFLDKQGHVVGCKDY